MTTVLGRRRRRRRWCRIDTAAAAACTAQMPSIGFRQSWPPPPLCHYISHRDNSPHITHVLHGDERTNRHFQEKSRQFVKSEVGTQSPPSPGTTRRKEAESGVRRRWRRREGRNNKIKLSFMTWDCPPSLPTSLSPPPPPFLPSFLPSRQHTHDAGPREGARPPTDILFDRIQSRLLLLLRGFTIDGSKEEAAAVAARYL